MAESEAKDAWQVIFVLPNASVKQPIENEYLALCPRWDARVRTIEKISPVARQFLSSFRSAFSGKIYPSVLLLHDRTPKYIRDAFAITSFRDCIALASVLNGIVHKLPYAHQTQMLFSDYFDIFPITLSPKYDQLVSRSQAIFGIDDVKHFQGHTSAALPSPGLPSADPDVELLQELLKAWGTKFARKRGGWKLTALFRSMNMAMQAASMPDNNPTSLHDFGPRIGMWVSAFEILTHPRNGRAGLQTVFKLFDGYPWVSSRAGARRYKVTHQNRSLRVPLAHRLYYQLYRLRNDFMHGNRLVASRFYPFSHRDTSIVMYAAVLYRIALNKFLGLTHQLDETPKNGATGADIAAMVSRRLERSLVEQALLTAVDGRRISDD